MEISDIVAYVRHTPENTNPAVIASMCGELSGGGGELPEGAAPVVVVTFTYDDNTGTATYSPSWSELMALAQEIEAVNIVGKLGNDYYGCVEAEAGLQWNIPYGNDGQFLQLIINYETEAITATMVYPTMYLDFHNNSGMAVTLISAGGTESLADDEWAQNCQVRTLNGEINDSIIVSAASDISDKGLSLDSQQVQVGDYISGNFKSKCFTIQGPLGYYEAELSASIE